MLDGLQAPRDVDAEAAVLGAAMLSKRALSVVIERLTASDFYLPKHSVVFQAISGLHSRLEPVDAITVNGELARAGELDKLGVTLVHELVDRVPHLGGVDAWVDSVLDLAKRRRLMVAGERIVASAASGEGVTDDLVESARGLVDGVSSEIVAGRPTGENLAGLFADLRGEGGSFVPTPWQYLNKYIGGLRPGALYILGARPGAGKTVVALNLAAHMAESSAVGFASLEMGEDELQKRLFASLGSVHLQSLVDSSLTASDWERVERASEKIRNLRLFVNDSASTLTQVVSFARSLHRRGDLGLFVVDYLQLMRGNARAESRQIEVSEFSRTLKLLAKELKIPVLALSQLNRASTARRGGEPQIADLRESGSLEQDADVVLLLHRDQERKPLHLKMIVAKNRHGRTAELTLDWEGQFARVSQIPWSPTSALAGL